MLTKRHSILLVAASLMIAVGVLWLVAWWNAPSCSWSERIKTSEEALEFGKYWLRRDERFWRGPGISSLQELNVDLADEHCCRAQPIDPAENDGREWFVSINAAPRHSFDFQYQPEFTSCRDFIKVEQWEDAKK